jgi:hypothetical protein
MAQLLINPSDQTLIENIKNDARTQNSEGVSIDTDADGTGNTGYCLKVPLPVKNFEQLVPVGSERNAQMEDMLRSTFVPLIRRTGPIKYWFASNSVAPNIEIAATTATLHSGSINVAQRPSVVREVFVAADFSAYSTAINTGLEFWIVIEGVASARFRYYFNESGSHRCVTAKWLSTLPPRASSVQLMAARYTGSGTITLNADDFVSLSVWG